MPTSTATSVRMFSLHALRSSCTFDGGLVPDERTLGDVEIADELHRSFGAPTLLDEVAVGRRQRGELRVDRGVADRLIALLERGAQVDPLRLRDLHERRAVEDRAHVEAHPTLVLVARALVLDRLEPRVERVARGALGVHGGGELAGLRPRPPNVRMPTREQAQHGPPVAESPARVAKNSRRCCTRTARRELRGVIGLSLQRLVRGATLTR